MIRKLIKLALLMLSAAFAFTIYKIAFSSPVLTETVYSNLIYPFFSNVIGGLTKNVSFSIAEVLLYCLAAFLVFFIVFIICALFKPKGMKIFHFVKRVLTLMIIGCFLYTAFVFNWGLNYARVPLAETMKIETREYTVGELKDTCIKLAQKTNLARENVAEDSNGVYALTHSREFILSDIQNLYDEYAPEYLNRGVKAPIKPILTPNLLSSIKTCGIFSPFTYEANINMQMPDLHFAATAAHEYAHLKGFAREDEASFIGWYVSSQSDDPDYIYSANSNALTYALNALYDASKADHAEVYALLSEAVLRDYSANSEYWGEFETQFAKDSHEIYNTYLENNGVQDGTKSYGRMVDLLIALNLAEEF